MLSNSHYHSQADQGVAVVIFSQTPLPPSPPTTPLITSPNYNPPVTRYIDR